MCARVCARAHTHVYTHLPAPEPVQSTELHCHLREASAPRLAGAIHLRGADSRTSAVGRGLQWPEAHMARPYSLSVRCPCRPPPPSWARVCPRAQVNRSALTFSAIFYHMQKFHVWDGFGKGAPGRGWPPPPSSAPTPPSLTCLALGNP